MGYRVTSHVNVTKLLVAGLSNPHTHKSENLSSSGSCLKSDGGLEERTSQMGVQRQVTRFRRSPLCFLFLEIKNSIHCFA